MSGGKGAALPLCAQLKAPNYDHGCDIRLTGSRIFSMHAI